MKYTNEKVRRQDRLMIEEDALNLLKSSEFGVLSLYSKEDEGGYGIPVNYVWDGKHSLYIHCAPEGKKLRCIIDNPHVSFCIIGRVKLLPDKFTTEYESIVMKGEARFPLSDEEKKKALEAILDKFSPDDKVIGKKYAEKSFHRVELIRIDITEWSGKCKHVPHAD